MARLVTSKQLQNWAEGHAEARNVLPGLIRRLVHATATSLRKIDFPAYESVQRPGFDGEIECDRGNAWIPDGYSVWELSVEKTTGGKADRDFNKRTKETPSDKRQGATYIALTARHWRDKKKWAAEAQATGEWKSVRAYDADDLEQWLENALAVQSWMANDLGLAPRDVHDIDTKWKAIASSTTPSLKPSVYTSSRDRSRASLMEWLSGNSQSLTIVSSFPSEVIDFVCAAVIEADEQDRIVIGSRMVVAETLQALRDVAQQYCNLIVLTDPQLDFTAEDVSCGLDRGIRIIRSCEPFVPLPTDAIQLERVKEHELSLALLDSGISQQLAEQKARASGGSLALLKQDLSRVRRPAQPLQIDENARGSLRVCLLLGGWDGGKSADRAAAEHIAGKPYAEIEADCKVWSEQRNPLLLHADNKWRLIAKGDAWARLHVYISKTKLIAMEPLAVSILAERDPAFELEEKERWLARIKGYSPDYSGVIRKQLADTLALLGAFGDAITPTASLPTEGFASRVVAEVLGSDSPWELWASLNSTLSLLAEASPNAFMTAVENDLAKPTPQLTHLFKGSEAHPLTSRCNYAGLLWALETLAWSPDYLPRVCYALLRLHKLHVPSNYGNSPLGSLELVLSCALPYTAGDVDLRIRILNQLTIRDREAAWDLLIGLVEQFRGGLFTPTSQPNWRGWAANCEQGATYADTGKQLDAVCDWLLADVGNGIERWSQVIDLLSLMPAVAKKKAIQLLEALPDQGIDDRSKSSFREKLLEYISRYKAAGATDRVGDDALNRLQSVADALVPDELTIRYASLFDRAMDRYYMRSGKYEDNHRDLEKDRTAAIREIVKHCGFEGVVELARECSEPYSVGCILANVPGDDFVSSIIPNMICDDDWSLNFAYGFSASRFNTNGFDWIDLQLDNCSTDDHRAWLLAMSPTTPVTWDRVDAECVAVKQLYWSRVKHWGIDRTSNSVERSVSELVAVGRIAHAVDVLCAALHDNHVPCGDSLCLPLEALLVLPPADASEQLKEIKGYEVGKVISAIQEDIAVSEERKLKLEVNFLKMLGDDREAKPATLYLKLTREPEFFVEVLSYCYKSQQELKNDEESEDDEASLEHRRARARLGYDLLHKWRSLPGVSSGTDVAEGILRQWVNDVRSVAKPLGYLDVCDRQIGEMIAHTAADSDGAWPIKAVCRLAEEIATERLAAGIYFGVINSRGVVCRGEGGTQERELATKYKSLADRIRVEYPFVSGVLGDLHKKYIGEGREWDNRDEWER